MHREPPSARCHECRELLGGFVLGALDPGEEKVVRGHLEACPDCAHELAALEPLPGLLDLAGSPDEAAGAPPATLERAVLERYADLRPRRAPAGTRASRLRRGLPVPLLAGALAGIVATLGLLSALGLLSTDRGSQEVVLRGSSLAPGASGRATLEDGEEGTSVRLEAQGLPPTPGGEIYELWFAREEGRVSAGTFRVGPTGRVEVRLTSAGRPERYGVIGVTREPDAIDPARHGVNVLAGRLAR